MLFNSLQFLLFFCITYILYVSSNHRTQNRILLVASYVFYGSWDWRFLSLILISTIVDYVSGYRIAQSANTKTRKLYLLLSLITNLGILGFFKYFDFFIEGFMDLFSLFGISTSHTTLNIILPVGISFYTFQTMSYTIDIYRKQLSPCTKFFDFALFVSFFPQLVAGPIERARRLIPQITKRRKITFRHLSHGSYLIIWGLFKKVVIADNLGITVDEIFSRSGGLSGGDVLIAVIFFAFQIYCDFSGYSDIARGISRLMGFDLMVNFNLPYFARNPSDFWRRWHISLSTWLKDYLYVSLGGNRSGNLKTYRNLMITMLLGGLWHGAAWNFVIWGLYHGGLLAGHRLLKDLQIIKSPHGNDGSRMALIGQYTSIFVMFIFTLYGWLLFRAESLEQIGEMSLALFNFQLNESFLSNILKLGFYAWPLVAIQLLQYRFGDLRIVLRIKPPLQAAIYCSLIFLFVVLGNFDGASFIYFQF